MTLELVKLSKSCNIPSMYSRGAINEFWGFKPILFTANISAVKITVFRRVPFPTVIPLYYLHLITAPSTVEKCKHRFTVVYYKIYTFTW